jgi:hypothetical protein
MPEPAASCTLAAPSICEFVAVIVTVPVPVFCSCIQQPDAIAVPACGSNTRTGFALVKETSLPQSLPWIV